MAFRHSTRVSRRQVGFKRNRLTKVPKINHVTDDPNGNGFAWIYFSGSTSGFDHTRFQVMEQPNGFGSDPFVTYPNPTILTPFDSDVVVGDTWSYFGQSGTVQPNS